jgi:alkylation response protein AidB-like acyl-CoA dehydrogenase
VRIGDAAMMEADELELFTQSVRQAAAAHRGKALDDALEELGWHDALAEVPSAAVSVLFEHQGRENTTSSALDAVLADALGVRREGNGPGAAVVLPPLGRPDPPGRTVNGRTEVRGLATCSVHDRGSVLVVSDTGTGHVLTRMDPGALTLRDVRGLDPELDLVEVTGTVAATAAEGEPAHWKTALAAGQRALAHELVGTAGAMLELARQHALERVQFGRPIASFQAVRHRLAESLVAVEASGTLAAAAWDDPDPVTCALAKAYAGRSARTVARHCQQVLAGIGFTAEHPFHRHFRRAVLLDQLLGGQALTRSLGADLVARRLPIPVLPL